MNFEEYLKDKKLFLTFFVVLMIIINLIMLLDPNSRMHSGNILYLDILSFILMIIYLLVEFSFKKRYFDMLKELDEYTGDIITALPEPQSNEEIIINDLISHLNYLNYLKYDALYKEKRDYDEFIATWVHEIKIPISIIKLTLENDVVNDKSKSIFEEIERIENYIEQVLYYSKSDDFSKDYFISDVNIEKIIKDIIKKNAKTFISKKISVDISNLDYDVKTDKKWLDFVLNQIVSNSLKYTDKNGSIKFYSLNSEFEKILIIEDDGVGIKKEDIKRIFDRGFTGYNGRNYSKSTGMGLYLSKKLLNKLGHKITVESKFGNYTKIMIHFPRLNDYYNFK